MKNIPVLLLFFLSFGGICGWAQTHEKPLFQVYVFLSDECPMCQGYAPVLNQIAQKYAPLGVEIIGVFPNYYVKEEAIQHFVNEYVIRFPVQRDHNFELSNRFAASITPEVFLTDVDGQVLYAGQIDNTYFRAGKRRGTTSEYYLIDALEAVLKGTQPALASTRPMGCVIVRN
jgi:thiol-disulfide isomerase/thioredoxin